MAKVITFGEIMLRLSPAGTGRFVQSDAFDVIYGGGEANVAVSCANYGDEAYFVSKLPAHEIGQAAVNSLRRYGVNTDYIARGGDRVGIYYCETGSAMRPSKVIYDRAGSAIAEADPADFDFDKIMEGADWFHWSGITPAISDKAAELTKLACQAAKRHGVTVSCDLNYRKKLWTTEKAQSIMTPLMEYVDVCITNEEDAEKCLGFKPDSDVEAGNTDASGYHAIFTQMMEPNFGIFNTLLTYLNLPTSKWLQSSDTAMSSVLVISIWKHIGYYVLIFIAAFQSIPTSITEAASLDNAGRAKTLFKIMIPMISPQIFFVLIILTINSFKVFDTIRLTTMGGPNNATTSIVYYIYQQAFTNRDIGVGSAAAVVLMAIVGVLTVLYFFSLSKKVHYQ